MYESKVLGMRCDEMGKDTVVYTISLVRSSDRVDTPGMTEAKSE